MMATQKPKPQLSRVVQQLSSLSIGSIGGKDYAAHALDWGSFSVLAELDLKKIDRESLKKHLVARGEGTEGNKTELLERLEASLEEERLRRIAYEEELEAKHRQAANLEEQGAVYAIGANHMGQLGLGDLRHRQHFCVIPFTRGLGVQHVSANSNMSFAVAEDHRVYTWGGSGVGPMGVQGIAKNKANFESPQSIDALNGEEIIMVSAGASHACALSDGGDLYSWGSGRCGALGLGNLENHKLPERIGSFEKTQIRAIQAGETHSCALTSDGSVYTWGHASNGRLGLGERHSKEYGKALCPTPHKVPFACKRIAIISCGAEHTVAVSELRVFSWGSGDGGRLGHGDFADRLEPSEISALQGSNILGVSSGIWHNACIVVIPPMVEAGWVYTWGSGFRGQLGQGDVTISSEPALVTDFVDKHLLVKSIVCGSHHNAAITDDGELYTWGCNEHGCLGHDIDEKHVSFTPHPGHCSGFGAIVGRIGRGMPSSVACGKNFTIVATAPYDGPDEETAKKLMEEYQLWEERKRSEEQQAIRSRADEAQKADETEIKRKEILFLTSKRLCSVDESCPGFQVHALKPSICRECGHSSVYHTIVVDEEGKEAPAIPNARVAGTAEHAGSAASNAFYY